MSALDTGPAAGWGAHPTSALDTGLPPAETGIGHGRPPAETGIDHGLARSLRAAVATELARARHLDHTDDERRTLAADILADLLAQRAADTLADGDIPLTLQEEELLSTEVLAGMFGVGGLQRHLDDPELENLDANGCDVVFATYAGGAKVRVSPIAASDAEMVELIRSSAARLGLAERRFDAAHPQLDLRLPDGSRLSALMGVCERPVLSIRRHRFVDFTLADAVEHEMVGNHLASFLSAAVRAGRNILVAGRTNAGKTTLLRALANEIRPGERIVTIEQSLELGLDRLTERHPDCVALEARLANLEGEGEITMADLVRRSLRMNPDRVIVGETLGPEILALLNAMSQGYGSLATIHADSSAGAFRRIAAYAVQAEERLPLEATNLLIAGAVHFVVFVELRTAHAQSQAAAGEDHGGTRRFVGSVREVVGADGPMVVSNEIFRPGPMGVAVTGAPMQLATVEELAEHGYDVRLAHDEASW